MRMSRCFAAWLLLFVAAAAHGAARGGQVGRSLTFLWATDSHITASGRLDDLRGLAAVAGATRPAFVVITGDATEDGRPESFDAFKAALAPAEAAGVKVFVCPGNHDVRWSPDGKLGFERAFGHLYQSYDAAGLHLVFLDSTVALEHWGHFDRSELDWLDKDLKKVRPETPVLLFFHHWIGRDAPDVRPIDNEYDLWHTLAGHHVAAVFTGHGHQDLAWKANGAQALMAAPLFTGRYCRVTVTDSQAQVDRMQVGRDEPVSHAATFSTASGAKASVLQAGWDDPDVPFLARRRPAVLLQPRAVMDNPDRETAEYRVDSGRWKPLVKDARDVWRDTFPTAQIPVGVHSANVRLTTSNGVTFDDELIFEVERDTDEGNRRWADNMDAPIQSSAALDGDTVYAADIAGDVAAWDVKKGKRRWTARAKSPIYGAPVIHAGVVFSGAADGSVYALNASDGHIKWHAVLHEPVVSTLAVAGGTVCVGADNNIFGLDEERGTVRWQAPAGWFFQSRPATDGQAFYLGGWDNNLYAIDAVSGAVRWKVPMGREPSGARALDFYYAPAIASPSVADGRVAVCTDDGVLHVVSATDGHELWFARAPAESGPFGYSSPVFAGGRLFCAALGEQGYVFCYDAATGDVLWHRRTGTEIYDSSPAFEPDGSSFAIIGVRGRISVIDAGTGDVRWQYELGPGNVFSSPVWDGRSVYTTTMAHDVQAINAPGNASGILPPRRGSGVP